MLPLNALVAKEIRVQGTHRFHAEFKQAVTAIASGQIDVRPIITARYPIEKARDAFDLAADRSRSVKVQLAFDTP
jgi:L-idonate 5-dehydrogenase